MHPSLYKLLFLTAKSNLRRLFRGARTLRGALLIIFTIGIFAMMIVPSLFAASMRNNPAGRLFSGFIEPYLPLLLLGISLPFVFTSAGEKALYFTPSEVDFLFPAPFHRREVLNFKLAKMLVGLVVMALFFSTSCLIYLNSWLSAFVGIFLTLAFLQLLALATAFLGQIVAEQAYTSKRRLLLLSIGVLILGALAQMLWQTPLQSPSELARSLRASWTGMVLLAPFEVFSHAIMAREWFPDLVCWGAGALAIDLGLLALIFRLDADYLESAAAVSQKVYEKVQQMKQGGGIAIPASAKAARIRLGPFPWLGGAGPLAWRQILIAMRTSKYALIISLLVAVVIGIMAFVGDRNRAGPDFVSIMGVGFLAYLTFIFSMQLPWAFRGDIVHMDCLKSLPIAPLSLAVGELAGGLISLWAIQLVLLTGLLGAGGNPVLIVTVMAFLFPFDVLMLAVSNTLFLIYPVRFAQGTSADFQMVGRTMLVMLLQFLILILALGIPAGLAGLAYVLTGFHLPVFAGVAWVLLMAEVPLWLFLLASTFDRFDPATETPT
jgi:Putative ABC exporter